MTQQPDHFHPKTIDEQIEHLTQNSADETADQQLIHRLHRFYQSQATEKKESSLDHAWERITQTEAYLTRHGHTQPEKQERRLRTMKTRPDIITDIPLYDEQDTRTPLTRIQRTSKFVQSLASVLLVGILIGSFLILFRTQHTTTGGHLGSGQTRSIIVASTMDGTVYAVQPDSGVILWQHSTDQALNSIQPEEKNIVVQGKTVYGIEGNQTYALNALNGSLLWKKTLDASINNYGEIQVDNGVIYISAQVSSAGHTYALQASNGAILWYHQTESLLTSANGIVYTYLTDIHNNNIMKAFRGKSGQLLWQYATNVTTGIVAHDTLYLSSAHTLTPGDNGSNKQNKTLLALNATTGKLLWSRPVIDDNAHALVVAKNMVIVGTLPNLSSYHNCAYKTSDGSQVWCSEIMVDSSNGSTTKYIAVDNTLYTITLPVGSTCQMEARNISNGKLLWSRPCPEIPGSSFSLVGLNGTVFVNPAGSTTAINVLDSHGNIQKTFQLSNSSFIVSLAAGSW